MKLSAGLLAYQFINDQLQVLLVHPGGPFYAKKDEGAWSIPKGEYNESEDPLTVALREFKEETGNTITRKEFTPLTPVKTKNGKRITVWAAPARFDQCFISSNHFQMEWPPRSGKMQSFPETDNAGWFNITIAREKINASQLPFINELDSIQQLLPR